MSAPAPQAPSRPRRRKPAAGWFLLPVVMMVAGLAMVVYGFTTTLGPLGDEDAVVPADGEPHVVELAEPGPRLLMGTAGQAAPECVVLGADGVPLEVTGPGASYTFEDSSGSWEGFGRVATEASELELTCTTTEGAADSGEVRVLPDPGGVGAIFGGLGLIFGGILVGGIGFLVLVLLVVLYATGAPRRTTAAG